MYIYTHIVIANSLFFFFFLFIYSVGLIFQVDAVRWPPPNMAELPPPCVFTWWKQRENGEKNKNKRGHINS